MPAKKKRSPRRNESAAESALKKQLAALELDIWLKEHRKELYKSVDRKLQRQYSSGVLWIGQQANIGVRSKYELKDYIQSLADRNRIITQKYPDLFVGAGTVLTKDQADRAISAGAQFIVTPGFNPAVVQHCIDRGITVCPGVCTPTEIEMALEKGIDTVKFFPAEASGGLSFIKAIAAPYTTVKFMPTGGISAGNVRDYLAYDRIVACGGSWMVKGDLIRSGNFDKITELVREAAAIVKEVRG